MVLYYAAIWCLASSVRVYACFKITYMLLINYFYDCTDSIVVEVIRLNPLSAMCRSSIPALDKCLCDQRMLVLTLGVLVAVKLECLSNSSDIRIKFNKAGVFLKEKKFH